jgi:hypothetical protein
MSVLVIAGVWVGDAFGRTQRGDVGSADDTRKEKYALLSTFNL